jgi:hypothetical protein
MNIKMIHEHLDAINAIFFGVITSVCYAFAQFDTTDFVFETFLVISKASIVGFFGGLFGYLAKAIGEMILNWIKSKL